MKSTPKKSLAVLKYGIGNYGSIRNALNFLNIEFAEVSNFQQLAGHEAILLPGVGSFGLAMDKFDQAYGVTRFRDYVRNTNVQILGICLGMQMLFNESEESPKVPGLGLIKGQVKRFDKKKWRQRIPHMGWSDCLFINKENSIFSEVVEPTFFFAHSFYVEPENRSLVTAYLNNQQDICVGVQDNNIHGVQFHPEKSQKSGLSVIASFIKRKRNQ